MTTLKVVILGVQVFVLLIQIGLLIWLINWPNQFIRKIKFPNVVNFSLMGANILLGLLNQIL